MATTQHRPGFFARTIGLLPETMPLWPIVLAVVLAIWLYADAMRNAAIKREHEDRETERILMETEADFFVVGVNPRQDGRESTR